MNIQIPPAAPVRPPENSTKQAMDAYEKETSGFLNWLETFSTEVK